MTESKIFNAPQTSLFLLQNLPLPCATRRQNKQKQAQPQCHWYLTPARRPPRAFWPSNSWPKSNTLRSTFPSLQTRPPSRSLPPTQCWAVPLPPLRCRGWDVPVPCHKRSPRWACGMVPRSKAGWSLRPLRSFRPWRLPVSRLPRRQNLTIEKNHCGSFNKNYILFCNHHSFPRQTTPEKRRWKNS